MADTTFYKKNGEIEVGDSTKPDFYPQVKIKKFNNESNFSLRLVDQNQLGGVVTDKTDSIEYDMGNKVARFYEKSKKQKEIIVDSTTTRFINRGVIHPKDLVAEHELESKQLDSNIASVSFLDRKCILFYGHQDADSYYDLATLPVPIVRFNTEHHSNPMYSDSGIGWAMFHYRVDDTIRRGLFVDKLWEATQEALAKYAVTLVRKGKKFYYIQGGKEYKFLSLGFEANEVAFFYLIVSGNYDRSMNLYKPGVAKDSGDNAGQLVDVCPGITNGVLEEIMRSTLTKMGFGITDSDFSAQELNKIQKNRTKANNDAWILNGYRDDLISEEAEEGAFEFDIVLKEIPTSNVIEFTVNTKNLVFHKQEALTPEDKFNGARRPANVVGSYAVYHDSKKGNEYQTGKVSHIYRPRIFDANNNWVWGDLNVDTNAGILSITIPQDFLNIAVYPVVVDPTFGYTTIGASSQVTPSSLEYYGNTGTISAGTITDISIAAKKASAGNNTAYYNVSTSTTLHGNLSATSQVNSLTTSFAWYTKTGLSVSVSAGTLYVTGAPDYGGPYDATSTAYDTSTGTNGGKYSSGDVWTAENTRNYSVYATYTASGGSFIALPNPLPKQAVNRASTY